MRALVIVIFLCLGSSMALAQLKERQPDSRAESYAHLDLQQQGIDHAHCSVAALEYDAGLDKFLRSIQSFSRQENGMVSVSFVNGQHGIIKSPLLFGQDWVLASHPTEGGSMDYYYLRQGHDGKSLEIRQRQFVRLSKEWVCFDSVLTSTASEGADFFASNRMLQTIAKQSPMDAVDSTFRHYSARFRHSYMRALRKRPNLSGDLTLALEISSAGKVTKAEVVSSNLEQNFERRLFLIAKTLDFFRLSTVGWKGNYTMHFRCMSDSDNVFSAGELWIHC